MANVSHGIGGAANIRPDSTPYADGEIVREGAVGDQGDGAYSSGRGGLGNIEHDAAPISAGSAPHDEMIVPETATREIEREESHHVGRGGAGNTMHVHGGSAVHGKAHDGKGGESLIDKVKDVFSGHHHSHGQEK